MNDQTIPADEVRKIIAFYRDGASDRGGMILDALRALLPPPPRPTLADMTPDERAACKWMQADVKGRLDRWAITRPFGEGGDVEAVSESGQISWFPPRRVIPRPDLPRLTWPGDKKPNPAPIAPEGCPPRDQLTLGAKWHDIAKLEEALRQKGEAADQAIVLDDEGDVHVWETVGGGGWMVRVPVQQCGPFRLILNDQGAGQ